MYVKKYNSINTAHAVMKYTHTPIIILYVMILNMI